jgi:hypothetical protein
LYHPSPLNTILSPYSINAGDFLSFTLYSLDSIFHISYEGTTLLFLEYKAGFQELSLAHILIDDIESFGILMFAFSSHNSICQFLGGLIFQEESSNNISLFTNTLSIIFANSLIQSLSLIKFPPTH